VSIILAGGASTNSRGLRPLPPGATAAVTEWSAGAREMVRFTTPDGQYRRECLSWVIGQSGLLWGSLGGPYEMRVTPPRDILRALELFPESSGAYGHGAEHALADALGAALDGVFAGDLACRFYQDGGTPLAAAARLARYATWRVPVASFGYHGAAAEWAHAPATAGILEADVDNHYRFEWGDVTRVAQLAAVCAAICVEVPPVPDDEARAFLDACRQACDDGGAVFILDEVVTGFRLGLQGAAGRYGVKPDIACYGKSMSATGCVSALVGRRDLVEPIGGDVFLSTTFGGSPGPCAVAAATVRYLTAHADEVYEHIALIGSELQAGFRVLGLDCIGQNERSVLKFETDAAWLRFCGEMIARGVIVHRPQFPTLVHTLADVRHTLEVAADVCASLAV
jgi:glutamate-1-semialdehyde aminotransferase